MSSVSRIVCAAVEGQQMSSEALIDMIRKTSDTLMIASRGPLTALPAPAPEPAVPIKKSITHEFIISLEDGRRYKSLKRHLSTRGMTPEDYRTKWGLPKDYPMVAAAYSEKRSALAKEIKLGRKSIDVVMDEIGNEALKMDPAEVADEIIEVATENNETVTDLPAAVQGVMEEACMEGADDGEASPAPGNGTDETAGRPEKYNDVMATFSDDGKIICMIDDKATADLGRYLRKTHSMSASAYREKFDLPANYPMSAAGVTKFKESQAG